MSQEHHLGGSLAFFADNAKNSLKKYSNFPSNLVPHKTDGVFYSVAVEPNSMERKIEINALVRKLNVSAVNSLSHIQ